MKQLFIFLVVVAFALTSCGGGATETPDNTLVISDSGRAIEVAAGNEFKIVIDSNPSTGYRWGLIGELDGKIIEFVSSEYRADEPVMPGSGGSEVWVFKALAAGQTTITLGHYPPGEGQPVEQEVTFTVVVK